MNFSFRLPIPQQRLMMICLLAPLALVCLSLAGAAFWLGPASIEGAACFAAAFIVLKPHTILSHFLATLMPRAPRPEQIRDCLAPVLLQAKARSILSGHLPDGNLNARMSIQLDDWRWNIRVRLDSELSASDSKQLAQEIEGALACRFTRRELAKLAVASFAAELVFPEPHVSNHVLIEAAASSIRT